MRVCDRCGSTHVNQSITLDEQVFDLCRVHVQELIGWVCAQDQAAEDPGDDVPALAPQKRGPGRPRKA
jgi:hypothetical protein